MINKFITFSIIVTLSLSVIPALAQVDPLNGYSLQHFTDEDGLPQNSINDIIVDKSGFLWLAAQVGMIRFNGNAFKLFSTADKPMLQSNVVALGKSNTGNVYFKTDEGNLYFYQDGTCYTSSLVNSRSLRGPLLLNGRKQLFNFSSFLSSPARKQIFDDLFTHTNNFFVADSLHLYLIYNDSLYYYDGRDLTKLMGFADPLLNCLTLNGRLYILKDDSVVSAFKNGHRFLEAMAIRGDLNRDLSHLDKQANRIVLFGGSTDHLLSGNKLYSLRADSSGDLYTSYLTDLGFTNHITGIEYVKDQELLVISTGTEGIYILRKSSFQPPVFPGPLKEHISQYLFGPLALRDGKEILTNKFIFDPSGKYTVLKDPLPTRQKCLYLDRQDKVWSSIFNLPRLLTASLKVIKVFPTVDGQIVDYKEDRGGKLYCLTEHSLYRLQTDSFALLFHNGQLGVSGDNETFFEVAPYQFWIGNVGGLISYDAISHKMDIIPELSGTHVRSIYQCKDGSILIGTYGQGYYYYRHGRFFKMPLDKSNYLVTAHCFLEDKYDNLWIPCNKGLFKVPKSDLDLWCDSEKSEIFYYYYGRQDGLNTNEFNGGYNACGLITANGFVSLLSMKGMVCFYADSLKTEFPEGRIDITNVEIDGKKEAAKGTIELSPDYNSLLLEISCPFLGNRNNLSLEYSLKGLSDEWRQVPEDGVISLSRLGPGNYTLRIRKVIGFGKNNYVCQEYKLIVIPHFYRATWFVLLIIFLVLVLLVTLIQVWLKLNEKRQEVRIKAEKLKGTVVVLEDTVEKLQTSQKALQQTNKVREKLISLVIHDLRSPLRFLTMLASDLHDNQSNLTLEEIRERTYWIKKGTHDIYNFSEDFLLWVTSQKNNFTITKRWFLVRPLLQEIYDFFKEQVQQKGNRISYDAPEDLAIFSDPHILITIIRNLVDNSNKYTDKGAISFSANREENDIVITVSDTGKGMSPQQMKAYLQNDSLHELKSGSQLGHKFIFDLTSRINGTISVDSTEQVGTTVKLRFDASGED